MIYIVNVVYIPKDPKSIKRKMNWYVSGANLMEGGKAAMFRRTSSRPYWCDRYENIVLEVIREATDQEILEAIDACSC